MNAPPLPPWPLDDDDDDAVELDEPDVVEEDEDDVDELDVTLLLCPDQPLSGSPPSPPPPPRLVPPVAHASKHVKAADRVKANFAAEGANWAKLWVRMVRGFIDVFPCNKDSEHSVASAAKHFVDDYGTYLAAATALVSEVRRRVRRVKRSVVRPIISTIFDQLVTRHRDTKRIDLDDIADVVGTRAVSYDEVEMLVDRLEAEGFSVGEGIGSSDVEVMQQVLAQARALRASLGRNPTVDEIATASVKPVHVVRRALERAREKHTKHE